MLLKTKNVFLFFLGLAFFSLVLTLIVRFYFLSFKCAESLQYFSYNLPPNYFKSINCIRDPLYNLYLTAIISSSASLLVTLTVILKAIFKSPVTLRFIVLMTVAAVGLLVVTLFTMFWKGFGGFY